MCDITEGTDGRRHTSYMCDITEGTEGRRHSGYIYVTLQRVQRVEGTVVISRSKRFV